MIGVRRHVPSALFDAALTFAVDRHWDVAPGSYLVHGPDGGVACSCGRADCADPGAHPGNPWWRAQATTDPATIRWWWTSRPTAPIVLPTGGAFDVIEVGESAGYGALVRLADIGLRPGPVLISGDGRMQYFVVPGAAADVRRMRSQLHASDVRIDLECRAEGDFVFAPPSVLAARPALRWLRRPGEGERRLPHASELLATIAYACYRMATTA